MRMSTEEKQQFLAEPHVGVLAVADPEGPPVAAPLWYDYTPGGDAWILTGTRSAKGEALREAGRCTLVVETVQPRVRYVSVACEVVSERPGTHDDRRAIAGRYLQGDALEGFLAFAETDEAMAQESVFVLRPHRWLGADMTM